MPRTKGRVLLAMSGGVDSSVAAHLLLRDGYEVVGCFMRLGSPGDALGELTPFSENTCDPRKIKLGHQGCCSVGDAADARLVAARLDIPLYVCNFKTQFGRVMDYFVDEYAAGRTPNPCVRCNDWLKFGKLFEHAEQVGADLVASGHYARVEQTDDGPRLLRGVDAHKDQSYVLFGVARANLARTILPVGGYAKADIRALAHSAGLPVADKPDSQEICFVPDNDYARFVESRKPELARTGRVLDETGAAVGEHAGHHRFTIGQRRGVGVALGRPIYVVDKNPENNTVTIGERDDLLCAGFVADQTNWLGAAPRGEQLRALVQCRAHAAPDAAQIRVAEDARSFCATFDNPSRAPAPGQAAVLYDAAHPERVLGGGWITELRRSG